MIGFRREVGADWWAYLHMFHQIGLGDFSYAMGRTEPGYAFVSWVAGQAGWGIWFPNLVCAIAFTWGLIEFSRAQPNPALALVVAFPYLAMVVAMGYTRQSAALGFVMLASTQYSRGANVKMAISLAVAASFHLSALVMIPILGIASIRIGLGTVAFLGLIGIVLYFQFADLILTKLALYGENEFISSGAVPRILMNVIPAVVYLLFRRRFTASAEEKRLWTLFAFGTFMTVGLVFVYESATVVDRLAIYLIPLQIFVFSRVPAAFGRKGAQNFLPFFLVIVYSLVVQLVWLTFASDAENWIPYNNYIWDWGPAKPRPR